MHALASICPKSIAQGVLPQTPTSGWDLSAHHSASLLLSDKGVQTPMLGAVIPPVWFFHFELSYPWRYKWELQGKAPLHCTEPRSPRWGASAVSCCMKTDFFKLLGSKPCKLSQSHYLARKARGWQETSGKTGNQRRFPQHFRAWELLRYTRNLKSSPTDTHENELRCTLKPKKLPMAVERALAAQRMRHC